jgi:uncharacterized protein (DUF488 family)
MVLSTLGYQGVEIDNFIDFLIQNKIEVLIDVRENPISRKKGFSKNSLREKVTRRGIGYIHFPELGSKRDLRHEYKQTNDWNKFTIEYLDYLNSRNFEMKKLEQIILKNSCCLMCFEADYNLCHRSLISNQIENELADLIEIRHLAMV